MGGLVRKITEENIWIYRTIVMGMLGVLGFIGSWMFIGVVSFPTTYVSVQAAEKAHGDIRSALAQRDTDAAKQLEKIDRRLDSIQEFLMNNGKK